MRDLLKRKPIIMFAFLSPLLLFLFKAPKQDLLVAIGSLSLLIVGLIVVSMLGEIIIQRISRASINRNDPNRFITETILAGMGFITIFHYLLSITFDKNLSSSCIDLTGLPSFILTVGLLYLMGTAKGYDRGRKQKSLNSMTENMFMLGVGLMGLTTYIFKLPLTRILSDFGFNLFDIQSQLISSITFSITILLGSCLIYYVSRGIGYTTGSVIESASNKLAK